MRKIQKLIVIQIALGILLLILIIIFYLNSYVNYLPYTTVSLENMTILDVVTGNG